MALIAVCQHLSYWPCKSSRIGISRQTASPTTKRDFTGSGRPANRGALSSAQSVAQSRVRITCHYPPFLERPGGPRKFPEHTLHGVRPHVVHEIGADFH